MRTVVAKLNQKRQMPNKNNKSSKSRGPGSNSTNVLKIIKKSISIPLSRLINISFANGTFPNVCKIRKVVPIFKNESRLLGNNYRLISLLSKIVKIIEKFIHARLN